MRLDDHLRSSRGSTATATAATTAATTTEATATAAIASEAASSSEAASTAVTSAESAPTITSAKSAPHLVFFVFLFFTIAGYHAPKRHLSEFSHFFPLDSLITSNVYNALCLTKLDFAKQRLIPADACFKFLDPRQGVAVSLFCLSKLVLKLSHARSGSICRLRKKRGARCSFTLKRCNTGFQTTNERGIVIVCIIQ
jgi:hypothetical protein